MVSEPRATGCPRPFIESPDVALAALEPKDLFANQAAVLWTGEQLLNHPRCSVISCQPGYSGPPMNRLNAVPPRKSAAEPREPRQLVESCLQEWCDFGMVLGAHITRSHQSCGMPEEAELESLAKAREFERAGEAITRRQPRGWKWLALAGASVPKLANDGKSFQRARDGTGYEHKH